MDADKTISDAADVQADTPSGVSAGVSALTGADACERAGAEDPADRSDGPGSDVPALRATVRDIGRPKRRGKYNDYTPTTSMAVRFRAAVEANPLVDLADAYRAAGYSTCGNVPANARKLAERLGLNDIIDGAREEAEAELRRKHLIDKSDILTRTEAVLRAAERNVEVWTEDCKEHQYNSAAAKDALAALKAISDLLGYSAPQRVDTVVRIEVDKQMEDYAV